MEKNFLTQRGPGAKEDATKSETALCGFSLRRCAAAGKYF
jgi:hypothetical protein